MRTNLVIFEERVDTSNDEDCIKIAGSIIKTKLKIIVKLADIVSVLRIGKKPESQRPDRRNIIVKLRDMEIKIDIIVSCRSKKPNNLFVNENLIPKGSSVLYNLRRAKKKFPS